MKGILFKEEMFKAVIERRKTHTRRIATTADTGNFNSLEKDPELVACNLERF